MLHDLSLRGRPLPLEDGPQGGDVGRGNHGFTITETMPPPTTGHHFWPHVGHVKTVKKPLSAFTQRSSGTMGSPLQAGQGRGSTSTVSRAHYPWRRRPAI